MWSIWNIIKCKYTDLVQVQYQNFKKLFIEKNLSIKVDI